MTTPTDPLYASQWHFPLMGDIETIWNEYSGAGVQVGVYDDGVDYNHEDLDGNYDDSLQVNDDLGNDLDPFPVLVDDGHGTAVAGLIAAEANGVGGTGVAHGASITGVNIFSSTVYGNVNGPTSEFIDVVLQGVVFDISSNSWGATPRQGADASLAGTGFAADLEVAYAVLSSDGRGGLGTVITQAAGNDGLDANRDGVNASRFTITVAATDETGDVQDYSNYGSSILVAAPAAAVTTDITGSSGYSADNYTNDFGGTSAATPVTSGVIALMLEANEGLGWRDVQNILAASASLTGSDLGTSPTGFEDGAWYINGADNWNGGGMHVHTSYGYGMINAYNAVRMAEVWSLFEPEAAVSTNELSVTSNTLALGTLAVPDNSTTGVSFTLTVDDTISIEHVALTLDIDSDRIGDINIVMTSPDGTEVVVVQAANNVRPSVDGVWIYGIDSLRGELSAGVWTVEITDARGANLTTVSSASLEIYGSAVSTDDVHHITDEFAIMAANDASRTTLSDTNGGTDWLNFAAVAGNVGVNLMAGQTFFVQGEALGILSGDSEFENAVTGDGDDLLEGSDLANALHGMRGADALFGNIGDDQLYGGVGGDSLFGGDNDDRLDGGLDGDLLDGGLGNDTYVLDDVLDMVQGEIASRLGGGIDTLESWISASLALFTEILELQGDADINGVGLVKGADVLQGNAGNNVLESLGGSDSLNGGAGDDVLVGGNGSDSMDGGLGVDVFVYYSAAESRANATNDLIFGFEQGVDVIDLSYIDTNRVAAGDQAHIFIGNEEFSGAGAASAGELRVYYGEDTASVWAEVDTNGNGTADMRIIVHGAVMLQESDFIL